MHMAYEAGLAKARVTVASLAVEPEWAAEWLKAEACKRTCNAKNCSIKWL